VTGADLTENPYKPPNSRVGVEVSALRERDLLKAYACFAVASLVVGFVAGAVIGAIIGAVWSMSIGAPGPVLTATITVFSGLTGLIVNYFVFRFFVIRFIVVRFAGAA
jgi:hypothetical protein